MNRILLRVALLVFAIPGSAAASATAELSGHWSCPATIRLAAAGDNELTLQVNARSHLRSEGRYQSEGEASVLLGPWPLTLAATSYGRWLRDRQELLLEVEVLELSPGSSSGVELQRYMIRQLTPMLPELPHTQSARIVSESPTQVVLEDALGEQFTCHRL